MRDHAVVIGASLGGLLAARVLAETYSQVTLLERDLLPDVGEQRRGVPQGRHAHGLLGRGREVLEELFPGLTADLVALGARSGDTQAQVRWYGGGHPLCQGESGLMGLAVSRPLLEGYVRVRVRALPNVQVFEQAVVRELVTTPGGARVVGVRLGREGDAPQEFPADLVVDASGRGSPMPRWLSGLGYATPPEERVEVGLAYASGHFRYAGDLGGQNAVVVAASPEHPRGAAMIAQEGGRWIVSVGGRLGDRPPTDPAGFLTFARSLPAPEVAEVVGAGELLGEIVPFSYPASVRRRYERLRRFPEGLLVFGDALCSFNPVYGQGMTVAALEALALRRCLAAGERDLARRFFRAAGRVVDIPWSLAAGSDLRFPDVPGPRPLRVRVVNAYLARLFPVAWQDPVVARAFLRVTNLLVPPTSLLSPGIALRVLAGGRRAPGAVAPSPPSPGEHAPQSRRSA